jgi:two-component system response regulator RpfG
MTAVEKPATVYDLKQSRNSIPTVLVLSDQAVRGAVLAQIIKSIDREIDVLIFSNERHAVEHVGIEPVDLVLIDNPTAGRDNLATVTKLRSMYPDQALPIVVTAPAAERHALSRAFAAGATDFLASPIDPLECLARCRNLLNMRRQYVANSNHARALEQRAEQASRDLRLHEVDTLFCLAGAADRRDAVTGAHLKRMAKYSGLLARGIGLSDDEVETIELAAPMHDIGKIGIPDSIMQKTQQLDANELLVMQTHARIGYDILKDSPSRFSQAAAVIALNHHEKFDGSGYPSGLRGQDIPLKARIVALADVFDALTSERPYKQAWEWQRAVDFIVGQKGAHFDPELTDVFVSKLDEARMIQLSLDDAHHFAGARH